MNNMSIANIYKTIILPKLPVLLLISFLLATAVYVGLQTVKPKPALYVSYVVSLQSREEADEFRYDGYYALQATDIFTTTLAQLITTPEVIVSAYTLADIALPSIDPAVLADSIRVDKTAPQVFQVTITDADPAQAEQLAKGLDKAVVEQVNNYNNTGVPALQFAVTSTDSWVGQASQPVMMLVTAVFLVTLFLGINIVVLFKA